MGRLPDCNSITAASLEPAEDPEATALLDTPAACRTFDEKCPGISDDALAFRDDYCELVSPCCTAAGLGSECRLKVQDAAHEGEYDEAAGAACLAALRERRAGADFCGDLGHPEGIWDAIPECMKVFGKRPPNTDPTKTGGSSLHTTSAEGDPCAGTHLSDYDPFFSSDWIFGDADETSGLLCDGAAGIYCDENTRTCTMSRVVGEACESSEECDATSFCDFSVCVERLPVESPCEGFINECEAPAFCNTTTHRCTLPADTGDACSPYFDGELPPCRTGFCDGGTCASPLVLICGT